MIMTMDGHQRLALDAQTREVVSCTGADAELLHAACAAGTVICPAPTCPDPRLATVVAHHRRNGWTVRHFRHVEHVRLLDDDHTADPVIKILATSQIAAWLRLLGHAVEVTTGNRSALQRDVRARVQATTYAIEVQADEISLAAWTARSKAIEENGMTPWWIWGHRHRTRGEIPMTEAQHAAARRYGQLWHVAANLSCPAVIGEGLDMSVRVGERSVRRPDQRTSATRLRWNRLQALMIAGRGILDPNAEHLLANATVVSAPIARRVGGLLAVR